MTKHQCAAGRWCWHVPILLQDLPKITEVVYTTSASMEPEKTNLRETNSEFTPETPGVGSKMSFLE